MSDTKQMDPASRQDEALPHLTCERCRDRKVKCDKLDPCTNCVTASVVCIPTRRRRLPRGRYAHSSVPVHDDLCKRIRNLESYITRMNVIRAGGPGNANNEGEAETEEQAMPGSASKDAVKPSGATPPFNLSSLQGPDDFWDSIAEEIHGLREVVDSSCNEFGDDDSIFMGMPSVQTPDAGLQMLGTFESSPFHRQSLQQPGRGPGMDDALVIRLCEVYLRQVDPIIKILHRPSVMAWLIQGEMYLRYPSRDHPSVLALKFAICYLAACSMTERQCRVEMGIEKADLVQHCKCLCHEALENASVLTTEDITVLQAFVLYLFARKSNDHSRAVWTLVSLAVRVATAIGVHRERNEGTRQPRESFFEQQMRQRLWGSICLLDVQVSYVQVAPPLIGREESMSATTMPAHVNDCDFDMDTSFDRPPPSREGITDTTLALVTYSIQRLGRGFILSAPKERENGSGGHGEGVDGESEGGTGRPVNSQWLKIHQDFEKGVLDLLNFCDPESSPFAWFTWHGTQCLVYAARLFTLRPLLALHGARHGKGHEDNKTDNAVERSRSLLLVTQALEKTLLILTDPRGEGFRWYITIQWHMLVLALSDCYACQDAAILRRAWPVIDQVYGHYISVLQPDDTRGKTQRRLGLLVQQTRQRVARFLGEAGGSGEGQANIAAASIPTDLDVTVESLESGPRNTDNAAALRTDFFALTTRMAGSRLETDLSDSTPVAPFQSWDDLMSNMSFDELGTPSLFFGDP